MCGRYRIRRYELLAAGLHTPPFPGFEEFSETKIRWNIAPSQYVPIIRNSSEGIVTAGRELARELAMVRWGLIPSWSKEIPKLQPINARAETVSTSGMFRTAFAQRRCLVPADGFYEWRKMGAVKQPMLIHRKDDAIFHFAGLWDRWTPPNAESVETMTIITTTPNALMETIHNRMPVILHEKDCDQWLNPGTTPAAVQKLLTPLTGDDLECYPVSTHVNNPRNDDPKCSEKSEPDGLF